MSVARAQQEVSAEEYVEWIAYSRIQSKQMKRATQKRKKVMTPQQAGAMLRMFGNTQNAKLRERGVLTDGT